MHLDICERLAEHLTEERLPALAGAGLLMTEATDEMEVNFSITADSAPISHRYMMASAPQLRRRRMTRLIPMACETVLRTLRLGGKMYSGGKLNPAEFASEGLDDPRWLSTPFILNLHRDVTPVLYSALEGKTSDQIKVIITTCLETYLLTVGATSAPSDGVDVVSLAPESNGSMPMDTPGMAPDRSAGTKPGVSKGSESDAENTSKLSDQGEDGAAHPAKNSGDTPSASEQPAPASSTSTKESDEKTPEGKGQYEISDAHKRMIERMKDDGVAT